jgi:hypothetical protein
MKKTAKLIAYIILAGTIIFHLFLNFPETRILADPNDNIFQYSLVARTDWVWQNYGCPLSFSCLPNLTDHNVTAWAEGYPLPFYYSHIPQIVTVGSYHLIIAPITSLLNLQYSLYQYYNLTKYLLLCFFPLSVFIALRIVGVSPILSALGAFFAGNFSTDGLYGIDPPSFLWRGYGLTSQLYAMIFLPIGLAFTFKAITAANKSLKLLIVSALLLALTTAGHLGIGIIGLLSTIPFLFADLNIKNLWIRIKRLFVIGVIVIAMLSYWIIPILLYDRYHIISFWDPIWKFNSYGWYEVIRQFFQGEIFDWQRLPIITILSVLGFFVLLANARLFPFALAFAMWFLLYFGRTTWGGLLDLIPGMKDFHQHRFIVGVQMAAIFLIPAGIDYMFNLIKNIVSYISKKFRYAKKWEIYQNTTFYVLAIIFISALGYFTVKQTITYASLNNKWIDEANNAYVYDEKNWQNLLTYLSSLPTGRLYAGRPGNWGKSFRLGSSEIYMLLGINGFDVSQFLPETWSMLSENEQNFDERVSEDYDLLNIRYIVSSKNEGFTDKASFLQKFGPFEVYSVPTSGWFNVVSSPMFVASDKTNFINLVHLWQRSYPRRWKMHPVISVEKKADVPKDMQKVIEMVDEVSYKEGSTQTKNIFADFPFVFPDATVSAKIKNEKVKRQTYSATVDVPQNCKNCSIMFKMSYHPNWQAKIDGKPASKYAVFPYYLAVSAPAGEHTVEFTYQPNSLKVILLFGEILILVILLLRKKFKFL